MNLPSARDVQCEKIATGLSSLLELLESPTGTEVFEIGSSQLPAFEELKKLQASLQQYLDRERDLFYVGFLGHFSSGKSTTINAILDTWRAVSGARRQTGLSPTDKIVS